MLFVPSLISYKTILVSSALGGFPQNLHLTKK